MDILQHIESGSLFYVKESEIILIELISRESGPRISTTKKSATLQDYSITPERLIVRRFGCWEPDLKTTKAEEGFSLALMFFKADQQLFDYKEVSDNLIFH